jgi:hypothetical protein
MNKRILQQGIERLQVQILKRKLHVFFPSSFPFFFSFLGTCNQSRNSKIRQNGNYQEAVKKNYATIDNHQEVELITKLPSENISR